MSKKKKLSMNLVLLILGIGPLLLAVIISSIVSFTSLEEELVEAINEKLTVTCSYLSEVFGEEWEERTSAITAKDEADIDLLVGEGIEQTIFAPNDKGEVVRYLSSIRQADGSRVAGTTASAEITAAVYGSGQTYHADHVAINGNDYYVCYMPIKDESGKIVGMAFAGEKEEKVDAAIRGLLIKVIGIGALLVVVFAVIVFAVARAVVKSMGIITSATVRLSEGYINDDIVCNTPVKEISEIVDAANQLQANLQSIVNNIRSTSGSLNDSVSDTNGLCNSSAEGSSQITMAVSELATASQSMAESVQELNEEILQIGNRINTIEESVRSLSDASDSMNAISNEAKDNITAVYESSEQSVNAVNNIAGHMEELSKAIQEVSEATKLISDISSQTNLLSLNASIEAARAGEAGKGFAVVASEISSLANQSDEGAKTIEGVTKKVLDLSNLSMELTKQIREIIADEQVKVQSTQESFMKLKEEIDISLNQIQNISNDAVALAEAKDAAVGAVSDLSAISEENAASTEEVTASIENLSSNISDISVRSDDMANMSETLIGAVAAFKEE